MQPLTLQQILYLSALFVNNFVYQILFLAKNIVDSENLDFNLLKPLVLETVEKAFFLTPELAQTGPARTDLKSHFNLSLTKEKLMGPTSSQIETQNQCPACGLDRFHSGSEVDFVFDLDGSKELATLASDSSFSKAAMKEGKDIAIHGGVALAWFVMAVLKGYGYVEQTEIGDGVDYCFRMNEPDEEDLNFLDNPHYVEVSGILEESKTNTLKIRLKAKHEQIKRGRKKDQICSVIVTLFSAPLTVKEAHP